MYYNGLKMLSHNAIYNFVNTNRNFGKTWTFKYRAVKRALKKGKKTIWIRRFKKEAKECYKKLEEQFILNDEYVSFEKEYSCAYFDNNIEEHFDRMFIDTDSWKVIFIWTNVYRIELK